MMEGWKEVVLGKCLNLQNGFAFKSKYFTDNVNDLVLIKGSNLGKGRVLWDESKYWRVEDQLIYSKYILKVNDILLAMDRPWVGGGLKFAIIKKNDPKSLLVQRIACLRSNEKMNQLFLKYVIASDFFTAYIKNIQGGVGVPHISPKQIKRYKLNLPPLKTQRKIAKILSGYDDLIDNNLKRIKLLEEKAQLTYEEWFVRLKFPGYENVEIDAVSGLPVGWEKVRLVDCCNLVMGQSPKSEFYNDKRNGLAFHQGVKDYGFRFPTNSSWSTKGNRIAEEGSILFSVRAPVGRLNIAIEKIIIGRGLASVNHKKGWNNFLLYQLQKIFFKDNLMGGGAIFSSVTKKDVEGIKLIHGTNELTEKFNDIAANIDESIKILTKQNQYLKEVHDILLPRLMTGMLGVDKIEIGELKEV